jgi:hypothetical protein
VSAISVERLLLTYRPLLRMDSRERWYPIDATALIASAVLCSREGNEITAVPTLDTLRSGSYPDGTPAHSGDYLRLPDGGWRGRASHYAIVPPLVYGHAVDDGRGAWLTYWMCYLRNETPMTLGRGAHQSDWERLVVECRDGQPVRVAGSQHQSAEVRDWAAVEKFDGRPVIYPRLGTHAVAFQSGWKWLGGSFDIGNGRRTINPALEILSPESHPWMDWPGMWGHTPGFVVRGPLRSRTAAGLLATAT